MWDAAQYLKFSDERTRPFDDLLAQVPVERPASVADLGCGPGRLTKSLLHRWPAARVIGVDDSPEMLAKAVPLAVPGRLEFVRSDIAAWSPQEPVDLIVSNAALQWLGDHPALLRKLAGMLAPGGALAVQMPDRFHTPSQTAIEEACAYPRWADRLRGVGLHHRSVLPLTGYVELLHDLGFTVNAWSTAYVHVLGSENAVLNWLMGTALRPLLARLNPEESRDFLADVGRRLSAAYPPRGDITLFTMPRLFFVATR